MGAVPIWGPSGFARGPLSHDLPNSDLTSGHGHLGVYPVELEVERVFDISIVDRPTYDYRPQAPNPRLATAPPAMIVPFSPRAAMLP